jgi:hypothetical protein
MTMKKPNMTAVPGQPWLSRSAAKVAYQLSDKEIDLITRELRPTGAVCPRKGIAVAALDQVVKRLRSES